MPAVSKERKDSYQESSATKQWPYKTRYFHEVVTDDLNIETEWVNIRNYDRHDGEGQDRLDEFAEISDAVTVALKDLTG
jgi:hypothetical protein